MREVIGNTTTTPMAIPDWNQTDPTKADYIKNKPDVIGGGGTTVTVEGKKVDTFDADTKLDKNSLYWDENVLYNEIEVVDEYSGDSVRYNAVVSPFYLGIENNEGWITHGVTLGTESVLVTRTSGEETIINWPMHNDGEQYGVVTLATTDDLTDKATRTWNITTRNTGDGRVSGTKTFDSEAYYNVSGSVGHYTIPLRVANGRLQVGTPTEDADATTKKYVDEAIANAIASLPIYNGEVEEV